MKRLFITMSLLCLTKLGWGGVLNNVSAYRNDEIEVLDLQYSGTVKVEMFLYDKKLVVYLQGLRYLKGAAKFAPNIDLVQEVRWSDDQKQQRVKLVADCAVTPQYAFVDRPGHAYFLISRKPISLWAMQIGSTDTSISTPTTCSSRDCFRGRKHTLSARMIEKMRRYTWRPGCPVSLSKLTHLEISHWNLSGEVDIGHLIVHRDVADEVLRVFQKLFDARFPIAKMRPAFEYQGDDERAMSGNNTSAFNCRPINGHTGKFSKHSYGRALDINPILNPYVRRSEVRPKEGRLYLNRKLNTAGMIHKGDLCYRLFQQKGWHWGGDWRTLKDYQHFEKP